MCASNKLSIEEIVLYTFYTSSYFTFSKILYSLPEYNSSSAVIFHFGTDYAPTFKISSYQACNMQNFSKKTDYKVIYLF